MQKIRLYIPILILMTSTGFAGTPHYPDQAKQSHQTIHATHHSEQKNKYIQVARGQYCMISENEIQVKCSPYQ